MAKLSLQQMANMDMIAAIDITLHRRMRKALAPILGTLSDDEFTAIYLKCERDNENNVPRQLSLF